MSLRIFSLSLLGCLPCWGLRVFGVILSQLGFPIEYNDDDDDDDDYDGDDNNNNNNSIKAYEIGFPDC